MRVQGGLLGGRDLPGNSHVAIGFLKIVGAHPLLLKGALQAKSQHREEAPQDIR